MENEIGALKHLLKGDNATTASEDIRESVLIYEGSDKQYLRDMLKELQEKETALQNEKRRQKGMKYDHQILVA